MYVSVDPISLLLKRPVLQCLGHPYSCEKLVVWLDLRNKISPSYVGGSDPALNLQLATALKKAKELGVPKENIEKALARVRSFVSFARLIVIYFPTRQEQGRMAQDSSFAV